jgi:glycosyltransferase involved in cell wall biosynthesis
MTAPDRVVQVLHILSDEAMGGGGRYVADLARFCAPEFRHVVALPSKGVLFDFLEAAGLRVEIVDTRRRISLRGLLDISVCAARNCADIVHTHGFRSTFYGRLALLFADRKIITTVHVSLFDYIDTPVALRRGYILVERLLAFRTNRFICISRAMRDDAIRLGAAIERTALIPNGVDTLRFHPRPPTPEIRQGLGIQGVSPVVGTIGRAVTEKGQEHLIDALPPLVAKWPDLRCLFVGDGPRLDFLKRRAVDRHVAPHCIFAGIRRDIEEIYPLLDVFVLPSLREPFGLALLEAMASGIPVIATAAGGPLDFIQNAENGLLVPPHDSGALAEAIDSLLANPSFAHHLANNGRGTAERNYQIETTVKRIEATYLDAISRTRALEASTHREIHGRQR